MTSYRGVATFLKKKESKISSFKRSKKFLSAFRDANRRSMLRVREWGGLGRHSLFSACKHTRCFHSLSLSLLYLDYRLAHTFTQVQCDHIRRFLQALGKKSHQSGQNILVTFWSISNNVTIM